MRVQISIIQRDSVMEKVKEEFLKKNPPPTEEEIEYRDKLRIMGKLDDDEDEVSKEVVMPEINIDDFTKTCDLFFKLDSVNSIYRTPEDKHGKTYMMILIGNNEYQAIYNTKQFNDITDYLEGV